MIHRVRVVEKTGTVRVVDAPVGASSGGRRDRLKGEVSPGDASDRGASQNLHPLGRRCSRNTRRCLLALSKNEGQKQSFKTTWRPLVRSSRNRPRPSASPTPATAPPSSEQRPAVPWKRGGARIASSAAAAAPSAGGAVLSHCRGLPLPAPDADCFVRRRPSARRGSWQRVLGARCRRGGARRRRRAAHCFPRRCRRGRRLMP